jgi:hypothetical protein
MISLPYLGNVPEFHSLGRPKPLETFNTPDITGRVLPFSEEPGRQQQQLGSSITGLGVQAGQIGANIYSREEKAKAYELNRIDKLKTESAYNYVRGAVVDLSIGEKGYRQLKGSQIVGNVNPVLQSYLQQYDAAVETASKDLTDNQKLLLKLKTDEQRVSYSSDFFSHALQQDQQYSEETFVGAAAVEEQSAAANYYNPKALNASKQRIRSIAEKAFKGKPPDLIEAKIGDSIQKINSAVLAQSINEGNLEFTKQYMKNNNNEISLPDFVKYSSLIAHAVEESKIQQTVNNLTGNLQQQFLPNQFQRLRSLVAYEESGNKDYYADGRAVTSPKGALFSMQVKPETAAKPGYGIRPAKAGTPEEFNRVGTEKLAVMLRIWGNDLGKALGSYNWGEGNVQKAVRSALIFNSTPSQERADFGRDKTWLDFAPKETKKYVKNISRKFNQGINEDKIPTIVELKKNVDVVMAGESREVIDKAKARVEAGYNDVKQAINQRQDEKLFEVKQRFDNKEILIVEDLTADERVALGDKVQAFESYVEAGKKKEQTLLELSPEATSQYSALYHNANILTKTQPAEILKMSGDLGQNRVNLLLGKREYYLANPEAAATASIDEDQFKATAQRFDWGDSKDDKDNLILLKDKADRVIIEKEADGKKLSREEKGKILNRLFVEHEDVKVGKRDPGLMRRLFGSDITEKQRGYQIKDPSAVVIPDNYRSQIKASWVKEHGREATDVEILDVYSDYLSKVQTGEIDGD